MITATAWVPRGYPSEFPEKYELDDKEMSRIDAMAKLHLNDTTKPEATKKLANEEEVDSDLKEYDFEHYDEDDKADLGETAPMFPGLSNTEVKYMKDENNKEEPDDYLQLPTQADRLEEKKEFQVYPTDNFVLSTRTEDEISYLDVYVYDDGAGAPAGSKEEEADKQDPDVAKGMVRGSSLYLHHDLMLPNFPLCVEWLSFRPNGSVDSANIGNYAAIGTMDPTIELWNLDCVEKAFPDVILGDAVGEDDADDKQPREDRHTGAVLSLSHNRMFRNVLCSTSADTTVKLWDLATCGVARSIAGLHHDREVSSSRWQTGGTVLLTGGYDSNCAISDVRDDSKPVYYAVGEEVEVVEWASSSATYFYAGTDQGNVLYFDTRNPGKPIWNLHAHDSGITTLTSNQFIDDMIATGAMGEQKVKLWKTSPKPSMVASRDFGCGNVLSATFAGDIEVAGDLAIGGSSPGLKMWDCLSNRYVRSSFKDELKKLQEQAKEAATKAGRSSRIARKYRGKEGESVVEVEEEEEDEEEEE